jgi:hypothetical protein
MGSPYKNQEREIIFLVSKTQLALREDFIERQLWHKDAEG